MFKKSLIFMGITLFLVAIIFLMIGSCISEFKKEEKKKKVEAKELYKSEEIKIIALREKTPPAPIKRKVLNKETEKKKSPTPKKPEIARMKKTGKKKNNEKPEPEKRIEKDKANQGPKLLPAKLHLDRQSIEAGKTLLERKAPVPIVQASYEHIGFGAYLIRMSEMGGNLFVGDALKGEILAKVVTFRGGDGEFYFQGIDEGNIDKIIQDLALFRPREISGEKLVNEALNYSGTVFDGDLRCIVMLPLEKEAAILGSLEEYLRIGKFEISSFDLVWGHYYDSGKEFGLKLEKGRIYKTGEIIEFEIALVM